MKKTFLMLLLAICISSPFYAAQSTIADVDGNAYMGDDKSRKQSDDDVVQIFMEMDCTPQVG